MVKSEVDAFYHEPKWKSLRSSVLREAGYMCQCCKLNGKRQPADHVHHIFPREQYLQYQYERWNLIALCFKCHNRMHNRFSGKLSKTGERLMETTAIIQGMRLKRKKETILVVGLRGSGKSTYVKGQLDDDSLAYDLDEIASAFRLQSEEYYKPARRMANDFLGGFLAKAHDYVRTVYIIRTAPSIKEYEQIKPDKIIFCEQQYSYEEMDDREGAERRLVELKNFCLAGKVKIETK